MQKFLQCAFALILSSGIKAQSPALTYTNYTGSYSITCNTASIYMEASVSNYTGNLTYTWVSPNATANGSNVTLTTPGQYTLAAFNQAASFSLTQVFTIGSNTTLPSSVISPTFQTINCAQINAVQSISATANSTANVTHQFYSSSGGTVSVNSSTAIYTPGSPDTYTYSLTNNDNGCSISKTFTVYSNDYFPTLAITSQQNFTVGCNTKSLTTVYLNGTYIAGGSVTYTILPPGYSTSSSYSFATGGNYTLNVPGTWLAIAKGNNGASVCESRVPFSVISNTAAPTITVSPSTGTIDCTTSSITLTAITTNTNVYFAWTTPPPQMQINSPTCAATSPGIYTLTLLNNNNLCLANTTAIISGISCVGIHANAPATAAINLFPNPSNGLFKLAAGNDVSNIIIDVYNMLGTLIKTQAVTSSETLIDIKNENDGIYMVHVIDKNKTISVSRIVKQSY